MRPAASKSVTESWFGTASPPNASISSADLRRRVLAGARAVEGGADVVDDDLGAPGGHREGERAADAPPGAGDDGDAAVEEPHSGPAAAGGGAGQHLDAVLVRDRAGRGRRGARRPRRACP